MEQKLIMMKGLPGCGKTTEAMRLVKEEGYKRVNKDDLRAMIDCSKHSKENEKNIVEARNLLVIHYLDSGYNVVVDDTNFHESNKDALIEIADNCDAEFEERFIDTPIDECIERDLKRGDKSVGGDVIFRMYYQYLRKSKLGAGDIAAGIEAGKDIAYIFDMDGTLALMKNRSPFEWSKVGDDELNVAVGTTLVGLAQDAKIIILSGRDEVCRAETEAWLKQYHLPYETLLMRSEGDNRKDNIVKKELYENNIKDKYTVIGVFDDRDQVVSLWRRLGLTCFQVDYGNF